MKRFLSWRQISGPPTHYETCLINRSDAGGLRPPDAPTIIMFYPSEYAKKLDSRRDDSDGPIESFWEAVLVEIQPFLY